MRKIGSPFCLAALLLLFSPLRAAADKVEPILDCTARNGAHDYTGYFGYLSQETVNVTEPIGSKNRFTPPPEARGQPTAFLPGRHHFVFSVQHDGGAVTWHLYNKSENSSQEWHERCKPICVIEKPVEVDSCSDSTEVNGSRSSTLNNNGTLTSFTWSTDCPGGYFSEADTLTPVLHIPGLDGGALPAGCAVKLTLVDDTQYGSGNPHEYQTVSCSAPVRFKSCTEDCTGTPGGGAIVDQCGICNGDNSTCDDCNGVPNGGAVVDECGVCGGHNQSCIDCAGVPNGIHVEDACGVCGGDGSTCAGGCPPGQKLDECGVCGGNGSTCADCAGIPGGNTPVNDCGECGDRVSTCGTCETVEIGDGGKRVLGAFRTLMEIIKDYADILAACKKEQSASSELAAMRNLRQVATKLVRDEFPPRAELCSGDLCDLVSGTDVKDALKRLARKLLTILDRLQRANRECRKMPRWRGGASATWQRYRDLIEEIDGLPDTLPQCRAGERVSAAR